MYYESRIYKNYPVADATEAANLIKAGGIASFNALSFKTDKGVVFIVDDSHIDDSNFGEVAVILDNGEVKTQIESITAGWVNTPERLAQYFNDAVLDNDAVCIAKLNLDTVADNVTARFTCGCCGNGFKGNVKEQLNFDQDNGYGICPDCVKYY